MKKLSTQSLRRSCWRGVHVICSCVCLVLLLSVYPAAAQQDSRSLKIRGVVSDTNDPPVPLVGVTIVVKGTTRGTTTDTEGFFSISADKGEILVFNYVGYTPREYTVTKSEASLNIALKEATNNLEEVVVVGMTSQQKRHIATSVSVVNTKNFEDKPITRLSQALQGGTTGVLVTQGSGLPGGDAATIKIRGVATLLGSNPLVLVDGMEYDMNKIDPATVENITILKDAAAASMYGTRAANGVILITTKRGVPGKVSVEYRGYYGVQMPIHTPEFVDAPTYMDMIVKAQQNVGIVNVAYTPEQIQIAREGSDPLNYPNTNWADVLLRKHSSITNHAISATGGNRVARFALSAQYLNQGSLIRHDEAGFERFNVRINSSVNLTKKLTVFMDVAANRDEQNESGVTTTSILQWMHDINPTIVAKYPIRPGFENTPSYGIFQQNRNPLMNLEQGGYTKRIRDDLQINVRPQWYIIDGLTLKGQFGYSLASGANIANRETFPMIDPDTGETLDFLTSIKTSGPTSRTTNYIVMGTLGYEKKIGHHSLNAMVGYSQELRSVTASNSWNDKALRSFFGEVYYNYKDKYMLHASMRRDGSSIFGPGHKWGNFPSVDAGWNLERESFMSSLKFVDMFKLRASYGLLGNNNIDPYQYQAIISNSNGTETTNANRSITWEKTRMFNAGADISLFKQKLDLTFDYFIKTTHDLILDVKSTMSSGLLASPANVGKAEVRGYEIGLGYNHHFNPDMLLTVNLGYSYSRSKWLEMPGGEIISGNTIYRVGNSISEHYGYRTDGLLTQEDIDNRVPIWGGYDGTGKPLGQQVGDIKYVDVDESGEISDADRVALGAKDPHSTFYLTLSFKYKNFDFETLFSGNGEVPVFYTGKISNPLDYGNTGGTPQKWHLDYWTPENPHARFPRLTPTAGNNGLYSDFWKENGAYVRVRYIQVGYNFAFLACKVRLDTIRLYFNAQNPFTITNLKMLDPETKGNYGTHPLFKVFSVGLMLKF